MNVPSTESYWILPNVKPFSPSVGRASHKAVLHGKFMWVIGGYTFNYSSFQMVLKWVISPLSCPFWWGLGKTDPTREGASNLAERFISLLDSFLMVLFYAYNFLMIIKNENMGNIKVIFICTSFWWTTFWKACALLMLVYGYRTLVFSACTLPAGAMPVGSSRSPVFHFFILAVIYMCVYLITYWKQTWSSCK